MEKGNSGLNPNVFFFSSLFKQVLEFGSLNDDVISSISESQYY